MVPRRDRACGSHDHRIRRAIDVVLDVGVVGMIVQRAQTQCERGLVFRTLEHVVLESLAPIPRRRDDQGTRFDNVTDTIRIVGEHSPTHLRETHPPFYFYFFFFGTMPQQENCGRESESEREHEHERDGERGRGGHIYDDNEIIVLKKQKRGVSATTTKTIAIAPSARTWLPSRLPSGLPSSHACVGASFFFPPPPTTTTAAPLRIPARALSAWFSASTSTIPDHNGWLPWASRPLWTWNLPDDDDDDDTPPPPPPPPDTEAADPLSVRLL